MSTDAVQVLPEVDYVNHPAYKGYGVQPTLSDETVDQMVGAIDSAFRSLQNRLPRDATALQEAFASEVTPKITGLTAYVMGSGRLRPELAAYTANAIESAGGFLLAKLSFDLYRARNPPKEHLADRDLSNLETLRRDGLVCFGHDPELGKRVWRQTWWERSRLRRRAKLRPHGHSVLPLDAFSPAVGSILEALRNQGVLDIASAYMGCRMEWLYAALDLSHDRQRWYTQCYADAGLGTAQTVYMHFDADWDVLKAMLYISDVTTECGPFRYVHGSHRWHRSVFLSALHKGFDAEQSKMFEVENDGLDYVCGYYRPRFQSAQYREDLLKLPRSFRGTTHFGDDILDGSTLSSNLLAQEEVLTGPAGTLALFDGSAGIHRGGQVTHGERWAVQIAMRAVTKPSRQHRFRHLARQRLRYHLHRLREILHLH